MNLDLVLGMSCNNISCLACDHNSGLVAHTASGVLVILNTKTNCQVKYFHIRKNCVSSASFSHDGRYITTGETGYRPAVRVWRIKDGQEVATMYGHEFGIKCVQFSPSMTEIVSVGMEHDNVVNVWAWPGGERIAANNIVDVIRAVAYSECSNFFVTAGCRHIKFWYPKLNIEQTKPFKAIPLVQPLYGRLGLLGECKEHTFIDVVCGTGASAASVFAITHAGGLVIVSAKDRQLKGHKNISGVKGTCIKAHDRVLFIGFNNGDIHMFNATTLLHLGALPLPTFFRRTGWNGGGVFTLTFNLCTSFLTTAYKNSSMCVWDMQDAGNVKQKYVAVYHSDAIINLDFCSSLDAQGGAVRETLLTVSQDSTVRLWGVLIDKTVCYDKLSIFYADDGNSRTEKPRYRTLLNSGLITVIKISPDRRMIVTGNKVGTICVYDSKTFSHSQTVQAHNREVTCLTFYSNTALGHLALLSGSRDRLIHIMDACNGFRLASSLNYHSSSIVALRVCRAGDRIFIVSCAADRSITLSEASLEEPSDLTRYPTRLPTFQLSQCAPCVSSPTDIVVDQTSQEMAVGFQDGNIRVLELTQLQERRSYRGCTSSEAQINKVVLDSLCVLLLAAASDKTINVINFHTGQILHMITGHNKCVTGLIFTSNGDHVISTSMDGCVFLWRLTPDLQEKRREIYLSSRSASTLVDFPAAGAPALGPLLGSSLREETPQSRTRAEGEIPTPVKAESCTPPLKQHPPYSPFKRSYTTCDGGRRLRTSCSSAVLARSCHRGLDTSKPRVNLGRTYRSASPTHTPVMYKRKLNSSLSRSSPPRSQRHSWRSLLNVKRTEDLEHAKKKLVKVASC